MNGFSCFLCILNWSSLRGPQSFRSLGFYYHLLGLDNSSLPRRDTLWSQGYIVCYGRALTLQAIHIRPARILALPNFKWKRWPMMHFYPGSLLQAATTSLFYQAELRQLDGRRSSGVCAEYENNWEIPWWNQQLVVTLTSGTKTETEKSGTISRFLDYHMNTKWLEQNSNRVLLRPCHDYHFWIDDRTAVKKQRQSVTSKCACWRDCLGKRITLMLTSARGRLGNNGN